MLIRIFTVMVVCTLVIFLTFWLLTGGLSRGISVAKSLKNPFDFFFGTATGTALRLPWQPDYSTFGGYTVGTEGDASVNYAAEGNSETNSLPTETPRPVSAEDNLKDLQTQYDQLSEQAREARTFGSPSPYRGKVVFDGYEISGTSAPLEYLQFRSAYDNTTPVRMAGWSLQSVVSGVRVSIPPAATTFTSGALNNVAPVSLSSDAVLTIVSGLSPVGVSFQENMCSGYLAELQTFTPYLDKNCPSASDELPITPENIQIYGESCIDYVRSIPICHFPGKDVAQNISPTCRNFAVNQFSYNGCVYAHRNDVNFAKPSWRVYLSSSAKLWRAGHDIIRLLDEQGRTVDVLTY